MDNSQNDHLKAYGLVFSLLIQSYNVEWLLNYKGGSFLFDQKEIFLKEAQIRGITFKTINASQLNIIYQEIENINPSHFEDI